MRWEYFRCVNIQSHEDVKIDLNTHGMTAIEADSETGKSVPIKCLRVAMFFSSTSPEDKRVLIRRGAESGFFIVGLEDKSTVMFEYRATSLIIHYIDESGENTTHKGEVPEYIIDKLGLIVDRDNSLILNIMDEESPMMFDSTSDEYNSKMIGFYANHDELITRRENLKEWVKVVNDSLRNKTTLQNYLLKEVSLLPYVPDLTNIEIAKETCGSLDKTLNVLEKMKPHIYKIEGLDKVDRVDITNVEIDFKIIKITKLVGRVLSKVLKVEYNDLEINTVDLETSLTALKYMNDMKNVINKTLSLKCTEMCDITDTEKYMVTLRYVNSIKCNLDKLIRINIPEKSVETLELENQYAELVLAYKVKNLIYKAIDNINNIQYAKDALINSEKLVEDTKLELGYCALCGNKFI